MASLNEISHNIRNILAGGRASDDNPISMEQVKFMVNYARAIVIKRDLDKGKHMDDELIQDLGCVPVSLIDTGECCEIKTDCFILRTKTEIPKAIDLNYGHGIVSVGKIDGSEQFQRSTYETIRWSSYEKYTKNLPRYYEKNHHIYVLKMAKLDNVRIRGIFEDPRKAVDYVTCDGVPCYNDDMEYPVAAWMIPVINEMLLSKELKIEYNAPIDEKNDARSIKQTQTEVRK